MIPIRACQFGLTALCASLAVGVIDARGQADNSTGLPLSPMLRVDPGMHIASISRMSADSRCSLIVTGSTDKTVRLWRLPAEQSDSEQKPSLVRTLRIPIGNGSEGQVYSVAASPNGMWIAVGGWNRSSDGHSVYIFEAASGRLAKRLGGIGNVVHNLAVSPDGRRLAASLGAGEGLLVWETQNWEIVSEDKEYNGADSFGAAFDSLGNLFTLSDDGWIRLYGSDLQLEIKAKTVVGKRPYSLAVNPISNNLAIGFIDSLGVAVHDAKTLEFLFSTQTTGLEGGNLFQVSWTPDGQNLVGAGRHAANQEHPIIVWDRDGRGSPRRISVGAAGTITQVLPCGLGLAVAASDPAFGILNPDFGKRAWIVGPSADMRGKREKHFLTSADAQTIYFGLDEWSGSPVTFDLAAEKLLDGWSASNELLEADTTSLPVTDWANGFEPKLDGQTIQLEDNERARSLAIDISARDFFIGTSWYLRAYSADGRSKWVEPIAVPDNVWGLNIAPGAALLIAAYGDGTIRWHRLEDGKELLAFYVNRLDRRWVAWTPSGYYMASPGAESLIGWHINQGRDREAEFISADRLRAKFSRPDIVRLVLRNRDEERAIKTANERAGIAEDNNEIRSIAPPTITIHKPNHNDTFSDSEVTIEYSAISPTGKEVTDVDLQINNAKVTSRAPTPVDVTRSGSARMVLTLPKNDVVITLVAHDGERTSNPASVRLRWDGTVSDTSDAPKLRAVFVGVDNYTSPRLRALNFAAKDAIDLGRFFMSQKSKRYRDVEARVMPNATRSEVLQGLEWLERGSDDGDVNLLFLSGHGMTDDRQNFYYLASDSDPDDARATGVSRSEIVRTIRNRRGTMIVMLDTCHSGASSGDGTEIMSRVDMNSVANQLGDKSLGVFLYASALGRQSSYERKDWGNGAFTKAMIEGLSGGADRDKIGYVETDELAVYVRRRVMQMTNSRQEPVRMKPDAHPEMRIVDLE